jgi:hypothetical protein
MAMPKCIRYQIPAHEIANAQKGVPMENLEKISEPEEFTVDFEVAWEASRGHKISNRKAKKP